MTPLSPAERLIVALDLPTVAEARAMVEKLAGLISFFKIGLGLLYARGSEALIDELASKGRLFIDAKLFDIPATVERAVARIAERGADIVTVQGEAALIEAAVRGRGTASRLRIFALTVLTSLDDAALAAQGYRLPAADLIRLRARAAVEAGCDGLIASAADDPADLRATLGRPGLLIATPGIRLPGAPTEDHRRAATPYEAIRRGADYLVVGRPILTAADPRAAATEIIADMRRASEG